MITGFCKVETKLSGPLQAKVAPGTEVTVSDAFSATQILTLEVLKVGVGFTVTLVTADPVQPAVLPVTVYEVVTSGATVAELTLMAFAPADQV